MKEIDSQKAARVWQRVQGEGHLPAVKSGQYPALIQDQWQLSTFYMQLSRQMPGKDGAVLLRLAREARAAAMCLRGICSLTTGQSAALSPIPAQPSPAEAMLRRCYGQELRLLKEYENRCGDAEYGAVFTALVQRAQEHCCKLLELIGSMNMR